MVREAGTGTGLLAAGPRSTLILWDEEGGLGIPELRASSAHRPL
jgi:hypothetical protein